MKRLAIVGLVLGCPRAQPIAPTPPTRQAPQRDPPPPVEPPIVQTTPAPPIAVDRLVPVRFVSEDPELALFAARIGGVEKALAACAEAEAITAPGFVRVTVDQPVPRSAKGDVAITPTVSGVGSPTLHACVGDALNPVRVPAVLGKVRRKRVAFTVDLRIGPVDPALELLPDHGEALVIDDTGGCAWLHDYPCKPNKSCIADTRRATRCPTYWGPKPENNSADVPHAMLFHQRLCASDVICLLAFERDGDACAATLHDGRPDDAPQATVAMACADFERLWATTTRKGLPRPVTDGSRAQKDLSIGANHIRPGWSAYRAKRWQWAYGETLHPELDALAKAMMDHARTLGLPIDASGFEHR